MSNLMNKVDGVREVSPEVGAKLKIVGEIADLARDNLIVHVGKPVGSITGWVGTLFWQVWSDRSDAAGVVHARIDEGEAMVWQFDAGLSREAALSAAKDRVIEEAQALRAARLAAAEAALAAA
ncbi:hypothetical protein H7F51_11105 [Novosphingobium flavum]|uniref:Uncharacterized protein n=1 Tax=Novosphingobium flavum TaxID=1778672 RepID=A0A7X1FSA9_9SPHN|nr:hypothetical protein [Novosphingobium flavum]MBC2666064.1 hypothetical protein [Novosphingobium flavum]